MSYVIGHNFKPFSFSHFFNLLLIDQRCDCIIYALHRQLFIHLVYLFRYRVQSPSSGREGEEQGATEPDSAPGMGGRTEGQSAGVSVLFLSSSAPLSIAIHL